jgi:hypothetical protein
MTAVTLLMRERGKLMTGVVAVVVVVVVVVVVFVFVVIVVVPLVGNSRNARR